MITIITGAIFLTVEVSIFQSYIFSGFFFVFLFTQTDIGSTDDRKVYSEKDKLLPQLISEVPMKGKVA